MDLHADFKDDPYTNHQVSQLCATPYVFMVVCAHGALLSHRGGKYHQEVTMNDEAMMVSG